MSERVSAAPTSQFGGRRRFCCPPAVTEGVRACVRAASFRPEVVFFFFFKEEEEDRGGGGEERIEESPFVISFVAVTRFGLTHSGRGDAERVCACVRVAVYSDRVSKESLLAFS